MESSSRSDQDSCSPPSDSLDWMSGWTDPDVERSRDRRRVMACLVGLSLLGPALVLASLSWVSALLSIFGQAPVNLFPDSWQFAEGSLVVWCSFVGTCLLWGRWKDVAWQRRSGMLVVMGFVDIILWSMDHAVLLGLSDQAIGHDFFRASLGHALGWAEVSLIASLAAEIAAHLGSPRALDVARGTRSFASIGASLYLFLVFAQIRWKPPVWPLRRRPIFRFNEFILFSLGEVALYTFALILATGLTIVAGQSCAVALRMMRQEDRSHRLLENPSDMAWDEFHKGRE